MKKIQLTRGYEALIDDEDYEKVMQYRWYAHKDEWNVYGTANTPDGKIVLHRFVMDAPRGMLIDHRDHDGLNNQKSNLRMCFAEGNTKNARVRKDSSSGYKGVSYYKQTRKYRARIQVNREPKPLGYFLTAIEAAKAYDSAAKIHHGEFAFLNFPSL